MKAIRLADLAQNDIERQLPTDRVETFKRHDLRPVLEALAADSEIWDQVARPHGAGRRLTLHGRAVAGFHLFGAPVQRSPVYGAGQLIDDSYQSYLLNTNPSPRRAKTVSAKRPQPDSQ